jgi:uncharacterized protein
MRARHPIVVVSLLLLAPAALAAEPDYRLLTAPGEGKVEVSPDAARIHVGVQVEEPTLAAARTNAERALRRVLQHVHELKLAGLLMKSDRAEVSLVHERDPNPGKLPRIVGYHITTSITIRVNDADPAALSRKASQIVDKALAGGANQLHGVTFLRLDSRAAYHKALELAIDDAKLNAAMLAQRAKVSLGRLRTLTPSSWGGVYPDLAYGPGRDPWSSQRYPQSASVNAGGSGTVVAAGSFLVKTMVTAVFEIK